MMEFRLRPNYFIFMEYLGGGGLPPLNPSQYAMEKSSLSRMYQVHDKPT